MLQKIGFLNVFFLNQTIIYIYLELMLKKFHFLKILLKPLHSTLPLCAVRAIFLTLIILTIPHNVKRKFFM